MSSNTGQAIYTQAQADELVRQALYKQEKAAADKARAQTVYTQEQVDERMRDKGLIKDHVRSMDGCDYDRYVTQTELNAEYRSRGQDWLASDYRSSYSMGD